jgi:hypothetical protein
VPLSELQEESTTRRARSCRTVADMIDDSMITPAGAVGNPSKFAIPGVTACAVGPVTSDVSEALEGVIECKRAERERVRQELEAYRVHRAEMDRLRADMRRQTAAISTARLRLPESLIDAAGQLPAWAYRVLDPLVRGPRSLRRFAHWVEIYVRDSDGRDAVLAFVAEALDAYSRLGRTRVKQLRRVLHIAHERRQYPSATCTRPHTRASSRPPGQAVALEPITAHAPPRALLTSGALAA